MTGKAGGEQMELLKAERVQEPQRALRMETVARYRLALVREEETPYSVRPLAYPADVARFLNRQLEDRPQEAVCAVYLDVRNRPIAWQIAYLGTLSRTAVEPRAIFQMALLTNANGVIIGHNHPSQDPSPSEEDLAFSRRVAKAGEIVGVRLVDSLILGGADRWVSLRRRGVW